MGGAGLKLVFRANLEEKEGAALVWREEEGRAPGWFAWRGDWSRGSGGADRLINLEEGGLLLSRALINTGAGARRRKGAYMGLNVITYKMLG